MVFYEELMPPKLSNLHMAWGNIQ